MSVINQMLLDLERRRASGEERKRIPDHVRALPGGTARRPAAVLAVAAILAVVVALAAVWWWYGGSRGAAQSVAITPPPEAVGASAAVDAANITQRMSLELAQLPAAIELSADATVPGGISLQSVIVNEPPDWATPRGEQPPAVRSAATEAPPVRPTATAPTTPKAGPVAPPPAINKRVREPTPRERAEAEYARGAAALQQGRLADAQAEFAAALQTDPGYHSARQALAGVLLDAKQPAEAMRVLQEGLQFAPAQTGFAMMLARVQVERGELDAAVQTLARSFEHATSNADYAAFYAGLMQRQQKHAEAVQLFDRALSLRANTGVWLLGMGISLDALGRKAEALAAFRQARDSGSLPPDLQAYAVQRAR